MDRGTEAGSKATEMEYWVLDARHETARLTTLAPWTFGRSPQCTETLGLPALSRVCLVLQHLPPGVLRVVSRQSNRGRVLVKSDDDREHHVIGLGSGAVHLAGGNYSLKVELPPVVLRMEIAVPLLADDPHRVPPQRGVAPSSERTSPGWDPWSDSQAWIQVTAMAVTLARYPDLALSGRGDQAEILRTSEALRRAVALWCGHTSLYWVNQRLREAADAADLPVREGGDRLAAVVAHYTPFFSESTLRCVRDDLQRMGLREFGR